MGWACPKDRNNKEDIQNIHTESLNQEGNGMIRSQSEETSSKLSLISGLSISDVESSPSATALKIIILALSLCNIYTDSNFTCESSGLKFFMYLST